jgi:thymidylate synthase (FAD)
LIEIVDRSTVELIKTNASDADVAFAAWVSNFAEKTKDKPTDHIEGLINFLWREQHTSPFEHGSFTFFVDTPIFVAREYERHRTHSYNETSGRYKELAPRFYVPDSDRPLIQVGKVGAYHFEPGTNAQFAMVKHTHKEVFERCWTAYQAQLEGGIAREVARNVLPLATMTQFYDTVNPLNLLKFFQLRSDDQALHEIRAVSKIEETMFQTAMPLTYEAFTRHRDTWQRVKNLLQLVSIDELEKLVDNR